MVSTAAEFEEREERRLSARPVPAARPFSDFAVETIGDELIVLDVLSMQYHTLNAEAARVWSACDGVASAASIASALDLPVESVEAAVAQLGEAGLLQARSEEWDSTVSRRRVTKLIAAGLIGAVGLPVIKSITAPDSAAAATIGQCLGGTPIGAFLCQFCDFACGLAGLGGGACQPITSGPGAGRRCCVCANGRALSAGELVQAQSIMSRQSQQNDYTVQEIEVKPAVEGDEQPVDTQTATEGPADNGSAPADAPAEDVPATDVPVEDAAPAPQDPGTGSDAPAATDDQSGQPVETSGDGPEPTSESN